MREIELLRTGRPFTLGSRRTRLAITGVFGAMGLLVAACSSSAPPATSVHGSHGSNGGTKTSGAVAQISISPATGTSHVKPSKGVTVTVAHGKVEDVKVATGKDPAAGTLSDNGSVWHSQWPLRPGTRYTVTATALGTDGKTVTATSTFRTLRPGSTFTASTILGNQTYGVGMPIAINFSQPVLPRFQASVERAVSIKSSNPVVGAFYWDGNQQLDFRTQQYWPQHTKVSFDAHFNGIQIAPGVYGTSNLSQKFKIGWSLIGLTSTKTHHTRIYWKGKYYQTWTDSSGQPGMDTADGTYLTIEKGNPVLMTGQGYKNVPVNFAVRFTWSGNYYHDAPWSLGQQGFENVSHGCINLSPEHSQWYYDRAVPGDPITITGSPVAGKWDDGYTEWFLTWNKLLKGSPVHEAVQVNSTGSTWVNPDTLPPASDSTLHGSKPRNYAANA